MGRVENAEHRIPVRFQLWAFRRTCGELLRRGNPGNPISSGKISRAVPSPFIVRCPRVPLPFPRAVLMWASTDDWHSYLYAPAARLAADPSDKTIIKKFQAVPSYEGDSGELWTKNLIAALERVSR